MVIIKDTNGEVIREFPELETLAGADLSYEDLMFADFRGCDLSGTNFEGADLHGAEFDDEALDGTMSDPPNYTNTFFQKVSSFASGAANIHFRGF